MIKGICSICLEIKEVHDLGKGKLYCEPCIRKNAKWPEGKTVTVPELNIKNKTSIGYQRKFKEETDRLFDSVTLEGRLQTISDKLQESELEKVKVKDLFGEFKGEGLDD